MDPLAGDIIGIDAHAAAEQQQITALVQMGVDGGTDQAGIIRRKGHCGHFRTQIFHLFGQYRLKAVFDQAIVNFIAGYHQADPGFAEGLDGNHRPVLAGNGGGPFDGSLFHDQRNGAGGGNLLPFFDKGVIVEGGAHHLIDHVKCRQSSGVDAKKPVFSGQQLDLALTGIIFPDNAVTGQGIG